MLKEVVKTESMEKKHDKDFLKKLPKGVDEISSQLFSYSKSKESSFNPFSLQAWNKQLMKISMADGKLKDQLFRFVDVLPNLRNKEQINKYLAEYISEWNAPIGGTLKKGSELQGFNLISELTIKTAVKIMAKTFIVGSNIEEASSRIEEMQEEGLSYTLDILGELAVSEEESKEYLYQYLGLIRGVPNANISVKLSSLYSQINPTAFEDSKEILKDRLRQVYREAVQYDAFVNVDLEHYHWKDLTIAVVKELLMEDEFREWEDAGIVIQGYLVDSKDDLLDLIEWAEHRGTKIMVRLVKGAYWDYETTIAQQHNWKCPVFVDKAATDANYEELVKMLFDNYKYIKPAIASHNIRSIAYALSLAKKKKMSKDEFEFQTLYGMLDSVKKYMLDYDINMRVYLPYGELIPGMAYLVRRLLENTANESFLRQGFAEGVSTKELLEDPHETLFKRRYEDKKEDEAGEPPKAKTHLEEFVNVANSDFAIAELREKMVLAIEEEESRIDPEKQYPLVIGSEEIFTEKTIDSINPCQFTQVLGKVASADLEHCELALDTARTAFAKWSKTDVKLRAKVLKDAAQLMQRERFRFNALLILESGKPWAEADGEVSEIIDFLDYYAAQALDLLNEDRLISFPGERNKMIYVPLGVSAVISPWNFPLAIMGGMTAASLVAGNTVIVKPSAQASIVAYEFMKILNESLEKNVDFDTAGVVNFLPGPGRVVGNFLAENPEVKLIAFTGSSEVGMGINQKMNSCPKTVRKTIAEMGGKNTIIVDTTADLDEAVPGVLYSAFGFAGQKCSACSRVVVVDDIYNQFIDRLVEGAQSIVVGEGKDPRAYMASVIDENAYKKVHKYIEIGRKEGRMLIGPGVNEVEVPEDGYFVPPTIFADIRPDARLSQEEIFGPVLAVIRAEDLDDALQIANNTDYGLTGALFSRSPEAIDKVSRDFNVGNFYINRHSTGAVVARQAFGGVKLSSIGFKAGGPNYLLQFVQERTITENTMRRGFTVD